MTRLSGARERVAAALSEYNPPEHSASDAREAVTRTAHEAYSRTREVSGDVSSILSAQMSSLAELASELASTSADLSDREAAIGVLEAISESVDRLRASYEDETRAVNGLAEETIREHTEKNLVGKELHESRVREAAEVGEKMSRATKELADRFAQEAERKGLKTTVERAVGFLEFDKDFSRRFGSLDSYRSDLMRPVGEIASRFAELYGGDDTGLMGVYSREELDDLDRRLDEVL